VQRVTRVHGAEVLSITLYGSQARGNATKESDIDLFVLVRRDNPVLREALADIA
jgi:predicted nucleotidyltransferase